MLRAGARAPPHPQGKADRVSPVLSDAQFLASVREFAEGFERMPRGELYRLAQLMGIGGAGELADMARGLKVEADARIDRADVVNGWQWAAVEEMLRSARVAVTVPHERQWGATETMWTRPLWEINGRAATCAMHALADLRAGARLTGMLMPGERKCGACEGGGA